jgi:hypothetical protein
LPGAQWNLPNGRRPSAVRRIWLLMRLALSLGFSSLGFSLVFCALAFGQTAPFGSWKTLPFGQPTITSDQGIGITGPATPASGLFFTAAPDPAQRYRLVVKGALLRGAATLRLRLDDAAPVYLKAPNGEGQFSIGLAHKIEVLIYSDAAFAYHVGALDLQPCPTCKSKQEILADAGAVAGDWAVDTFQQPDVSRSADGLHIAASNPPAGLFFRKTLDASKIYRVTMTGARTAGAATLRVTTGGKPPAYSPAPDGSTSKVINAADSVELLIYGDAPFSYTLKALSIEECPRCPTDGQLKQIIRAKLPGIDEQAKTDTLHAAGRLLQWTASVVEVGGEIDAFRETAQQLPAMTAAQIYSDVWLADAGGAACSGFAVFFEKVLALFNIPAFTINIGYDGTSLTHVTTIIPHDGKFYVFDPTFGGAYLNEAGDYVDLPAVVAGLPAKFKAGPISRTMLFPLKRAEAAKTMFAEFGFHPRCESNSSYMKCDDVPYSASVLKYEWSNDLQRERIPNNADLILALLRHKIQSVSAIGNTREQFLSAMAAALR